MHLAPPRAPALAALALLVISANQAIAADTTDDKLQARVDAVIHPLMQQQGIAGMAVAVIADGHEHYFTYGMANKAEHQPVSRDTLFEIGSLTKTFTATLAALAHAEGKLDLEAPANRYLPALSGTPLGDASVLEFGTYSAGCLPLQFPDEVKTPQQVLAFYQHWQPRAANGSQRCYSNPSLGLFGYLAARSQGKPFATVMAQQLLPQLGLAHTYLQVPASQQSLYAQGYDAQDRPVRVTPGPLGDEAYSLKSSAVDLLRYARLNLHPAPLDTNLRQAITITQAGYFQVGAMTQGLGWERYPYPVSLDTLQHGNSADMALEPQPIKRLRPASPALPQAWYNKTGSTSGFGAYLAFVPSRGLGIVLLANKNYPNGERVRAAHEILSVLEQ
ncbi:class C beta-lactamase [Pseudomonas sp. X10]